MRFIRMVKRLFGCLYAIVLSVVSTIVAALRNWRRWINTATTAVAIGAAQAAYSQQAYRVDDANGSDSSDGYPDWSDALQTIQEALTRVSPGDSIWVSEGEYYPTAETVINDAKSATFKLVSGVKIFGGFPSGGGNGTFTARDPLTYISILTGDLSTMGAVAGGCPNPEGGDCLTATPGVGGCQFSQCCTIVCAIDDYCCNTEWDASCVAIGEQFNECTGEPIRARHVVTAFNVTDQTMLNGFTITGGLEDGMDSTAVFGAGIYIQPGPDTPGSPARSDPVIVNCTFVDNKANGSPGGAGHVAGAINNGAHPKFIDCKFLGNTSTGEGGGFCNDGGDVTFVNCLFSGNTCGGKGGAVFNAQNSLAASTATFINCTLSRNQAINSVDAIGGGVFNGSQATLQNCILWGNEDDGGITEDAQVHDLGALGSSTTVEYSCVDHLDVYAGNNNIDDDPVFEDDDGADDVVGTLDDDLRLQSGSPSIDVGLNSTIPPDAFDVNDDSNTSEATPDLLHAARIAPDDGTIDMGAYERPCIVTACHLADIVTQSTLMPPGDGIVNGADLGFMLDAWGSNPGSPADIVTTATVQPPGDGVVNGADLGILLDAWGSCGESMMAGGANPLNDETLGPLLEELMETSDADLAATIAALLEEMSGE